MGVGAVLFIMDGEGSPKGPREVSLPLQNGILAKMITSQTQNDRLKMARYDEPFVFP